jgi:hypothetical protein
MIFLKILNVGQSRYAGVFEFNVGQRSLLYNLTCGGQGRFNAILQVNGEHPSEKQR